MPIQIHYLSHPFTQSMPVYGGRGDLELTSLKDMKKGDSCNTWRLGGLPINEQIKTGELKVPTMVRER